jgi:hypothetical protein
MTSKAGRRKDILDTIGNVKNQQRTNNGLSRQNFSGLASGDFGSVAGTSSGGSSASNGYLAGDNLGSHIATQNLNLANYDVIGVNSIQFFTTNQTITDDANGMRFSLPDAQDTYDFSIDGNQSISMEKFFLNLTNTRIQMLEEAAPSAPTSLNHYVYVDSTSHHLTVKHNGSTFDLEGAGGWVGTASSDLNMAGFDILNIDVLGFTSIGGQINVADVTAGFNFVTTSNRPFRFTPNATNVLDITTAGISMIAGDIDLNNLNIIGVNSLMFNTTGQMITDNANGIRFSMTDATDTFDFTIDSNLNLSIQKYFIDFNNSRIQMTEEIAPSAPASTKNYVYVDSTSHHLTIRHPTGSPVDLESGGGGWVGSATSDLDMNNFDIKEVGQIEFSSTSHYIKSNSVGFEYRVPVGDDHEFFVNGVSEFKVDGGVCIVKNDLQVDDDVTLGSTSADAVTVNGLVNWATNYSAVGLPASTSAGYITIQVGGVAKKLYYYS